MAQRVSPSCEEKLAVFVPHPAEARLDFVHHYLAPPPSLARSLMPHGHHSGFRLKGTATGNMSCFDASLDLKLMASPCYQGNCAGGNGSCVCLPGWTGYTDAVPMDTTEWPGGKVLSCGVNTTVVKCLWAMAIIPAIAIAVIMVKVRSLPGRL